MNTPTESLRIAESFFLFLGGFVIVTYIATAPEKRRKLFIPGMLTILFSICIIASLEFAFYSQSQMVGVENEDTISTIIPPTIMSEDAISSNSDEGADDIAITITSDTITEELPISATTLTSTSSIVASDAISTTSQNDTIADSMGKLSGGQICFGIIILMVFLFWMFGNTDITSQKTTSTIANKSLEETMEIWLTEYQKAVEIGDYETATQKKQAIDLIGLAGMSRQIGNYQSEMMHLEKLLSLEPDFASGWLNLGRVYDDLGRVTDSVSADLRAARLNPQYVKAWYNLGLVYSKREGWYDFDMALSYYQKALNCYPITSQEKAAVYSGVGDLHLCHHLDINQALLAYEIANQLNPTDMGITHTVRQLQNPEFKIRLMAKFNVQAVDFSPSGVMVFVGSSTATTRDGRDSASQTQSTIDDLLHD